MPFGIMTIDDKPLLDKILRENPFKKEQIEFQKLDQQKLVSFHARMLANRIENPDSPLWLFKRNNRYGLIGIQKSANHSAFFGVPIFSVDPILTYSLLTIEKHEILCALGDVLESRGARIIWARFDERERDLFQCLSQMGADYCGAGVRMSRWIGTGPSAKDAGTCDIRLAGKDDLAAIMEIARNGHQHSHFFNDPHLQENKKRGLFPHYIEECFGRDNRPLLVALDKRGRLAGFSLLLTPSGQLENIGQSIGIVDFIVVDPDCQGQGIGQSLLNASIELLRNKNYDLVELKTMLDNLQAIAFYQKNGFRIISSEAHFTFGSTVGRWHL